MKKTIFLYPLPIFFSTVRCIAHKEEFSTIISQKNRGFFCNNITKIAGRSASPLFFWINPNALHPLWPRSSSHEQPFDLLFTTRQCPFCDCFSFRTFPHLRWVRHDWPLYPWRLRANKNPSSYYFFMKLDAVQTERKYTHKQPSEK
jgi:hypothetical protein